MTKDRTEEQPEISGGRAFPEEGEPCRRPGSGQWKQFRTAMKDLKRKNEEGSPAESREADTEQAEDTERPVCRKDRKKCSILFTSFGKRAYLPQIFAEAMDRLGLTGTIYAGDCTGRIACPEAVVPVKLPPILESGGGIREEGGSGRSASRNSGVRDPNGTDREPMETFEPAESTASPHRPSGKQEERYVQFLLAFTRTHRIDLVIPLIDLDVWVLSRYREAFARQGVCLLTPDPAAADICENKWRCGKFLQGHGIPVPEMARGLSGAERMLEEGILHFPLLVKPVHGNGSLGILEAGSRKELEILYRKALMQAMKEPKIWTGEDCWQGESECGILLIQQKIETGNPDDAVRNAKQGAGDEGRGGQGQDAALQSREGQEGAERDGDCCSAERRAPIAKRWAPLSAGEYGLDVICDLEGRYQETIVRKKLRMQGGETQEAVTVSAPQLEALGERLAHLLHPRAILDVDVMVDAHHIPYVLDCNDRFGGGFPFSRLSGSRLPEQLLLWALAWKREQVRLREREEDSSKGLAEPGEKTEAGKRAEGNRRFAGIRESSGVRKAQEAEREGRIETTLGAIPGMKISPSQRKEEAEDRDLWSRYPEKITPGIYGKKVVTVLRCLPAGAAAFAWAHGREKVRSLLACFGEMVTPPLSARGIDLDNLAAKIDANGFALVCTLLEKQEGMMTEKTQERTLTGSREVGALREREGGAEDRKKAGIPIAFAYGYANDRRTPGGRAVISFLAVDPAYRDLHIGERMIRICERRALEEGMTKMAFTASRENSGAMRLYLRMGYQIASGEERRSFFGAAGVRPWLQEGNAV